MTIERLIEKFEEIRLFAQEAKGKTYQDEECINRIYQICEDINIDWQIEKRLNEHTTISK